jgi:aminomethyltransferase
VDPADLHQSPLSDRHVDAGAKMADFGGWWMPIEYPGGGVIAEHTAVRERVGVFDVSHLGKAAVRGEGARDFVNACLTNDLGRIGPGQAQYTLCCDDVSGGVVDDMIAYLYADDDVFLVPNAANAAEVVRRLSAAAPERVDVEDLHHRLAVIAVQGPRSAALLADLDLPTELDYMSFVDADWAGRPVVVGRTGYTGEHGYELLPRADAGPLWDALLEAGSSYDALPCGLGARDTLRTEMGYPLHGQDLTLHVTPVQGRCSWAVGWDKPAFWGRDVLVRERAEKPARRLLGLRAVGKGIPRPQMTVTGGDGGEVGMVTSGTFSPTLRTGIGLALLDRSVSDGDEVNVDIRGRTAAMTVVKPPFVSKSPK